MKKKVKISYTDDNLVNVSISKKNHDLPTLQQVVTLDEDLDFEEVVQLIKDLTDGLASFPR